MQPLRIFAFETQPVMVEGLRRVVENASGLMLVGHSDEIESAIDEAAKADANVLLVGQPPMLKSALSLLARIKERNVSAHVVLWANELSDMDSFRALHMGARGVLTRLQKPETLVECIRSVGGGSVWLEPSSRPLYGVPYRRSSALRITPRERQIIEYVCRGMKNKEIAEALSITPGTVKVHLMHIFEKTGAKDRFQLALQGRLILGSVDSENSADSHPPD